MRQLSYVVAVADEGTFTAAAESCHVTQPTLSQGIASLERELGVDLFHRLPRGVTPTAAGTAILGPAREATAALRAAREAVAAVRGVIAGTLDLVTLPTLAAAPTAGVVGSFRRAHPGVTVRISHLEDPAAAVEALRSGRAELAVTEIGPPRHGFVQVEMGLQRYVAAMAPGSRRRKLVRIDELARMPLVTTPPGTSTRRHLDDACAEAGIEAAIAVETAQRDALVPLVVAGAGAAMLTEELAAQAAAQGAVVAPITPAVTRRIGIVHRDATSSPAAAAMIARVEADPH